MKDMQSVCTGSPIWDLHLGDAAERLETLDTRLREYAEQLSLDPPLANNGNMAKRYLLAIEICEELFTVAEESLDADKTNYKAAGIETILIQLRKCQPLYGCKDSKFDLK